MDLTAPMNLNVFISELFTIVLIPLLGILVKYFVNFVNLKAKELKEKTENDKYRKYITLLQNTIISAVTATNQTYVNSLKEQGKFDKEAQIEAFNKTYAAVMSVLTDEAQECLNEAIGDLKTYIVNSIEEQVNEQKL